MKYITLTLVACAVLCGCANPYTRSYVAYAASRSANPVQNPRIEFVMNARETVEKSYSDANYVKLGYSSFTTSRNASEEKVIEQARKVNADIVVYDCFCLSSESGFVPLVSSLPDPAFSIFGRGMSGTPNSAMIGYSGQPTPVGFGGTTTRYVPYEKSVCKYNAYFLQKLDGK